MAIKDLTTDKPVKGNTTTITRHRNMATGKNGNWRHATKQQTGDRATGNKTTCDTGRGNMVTRETATGKTVSEKNSNIQLHVIQHQAIWQQEKWLQVKP